MAKRAEELRNLQTRKPEQVRTYARFFEEHLTDLITESTWRRSELTARIHALLKEAQRQGVDKGHDKWVRARLCTVGLVTCAMGLRMARMGLRTLYPNLEQYAGVAIDGLRDKKYGTDWRKKAARNEAMEV
ncbi:hypothetical protein F5972_08715 [Microbispora cellulosiformans]|uniref:Uncharacterized protein n=1 Tax=Microbispora cellulosiformans TaxID=2614688 RepID=A0A5J5K5H1_9ACTN|nr:hypothetical protein [Microbispora cellulosiformans]KAA9379722.1 hypothetical protein F5972_08715 [Microbispora cellulosiformans]